MKVIRTAVLLEEDLEEDLGEGERMVYPKDSKVLYGQHYRFSYRDKGRKAKVRIWEPEGDVKGYVFSHLIVKVSCYIIKYPVIFVCSTIQYQFSCVLQLRWRRMRGWELLGEGDME